MSKIVSKYAERNYTEIAKQSQLTRVSESRDKILAGAEGQISSMLLWCVMLVLVGMACGRRPVVGRLMHWTTTILGSAASLILVVTIGYQITRQWQSGTSKGVSKWLFIGQGTASAMFTVYSWLINNWVFVLTNGLMFLSAIAGLAIVLIHHRRNGGEETK